MEEHIQPQQQQRLQEEPPASNSPAPWPPPLPAEREGKQGLKDEGLGLWGLTVGKMPDVGLQQQQQCLEEPPASTSPAPWPPPVPDEREDEQGVRGFCFFSSFVG